MKHVITQETRSGQLDHMKYQHEKVTETCRVEDVNKR